MRQQNIPNRKTRQEVNESGSNYPLAAHKGRYPSGWGISILKVIAVSPGLVQWMVVAIYSDVLTPLKAKRMAGIYPASNASGAMIISGARYP